MSEPAQNIRVLEITVTDGVIDGRLYRDQEKNPYATGNGDFQPTEEQVKFIGFFIEQLQFLVDKDILASNTVLTDEKKKKKALRILTELVTLLGEYLYRVLFNKEIEYLLNKAMDGDPELLRIQLEFKKKSSTYADWPWEYLYQPSTTPGAGVFLAKVTNLMLIRRLTMQGDIPGMQTHRPKVLLIISQPKGYDVQCENLLTTLDTLKKGRSIDLTILQKEDNDPKRPPKQNVTYENLWDIITKSTFDIIHFVGHGQCTPDGAQLALTDSKGEVDWRYDSKIAEMIDQAKQRPKLVFLQACESALPDTYRGVSGVARALALKKIPAVVAMQYKIMNSIANNFACAFYEKLATGLPIDLAVQAGRRAINQYSDDDDFQYHAFGLPVLYLRSYDSIFPKVLPDPSVESDAFQSEPQGKREIICTYAPGSCPAPDLRPDETVCYNCGCDLYCPACHEPLKRPQGNFCTNPKCKHRLTPEPSGAAPKQDLPANGTPKQPETQVITPGTYVPAIGMGRG